EEGVPVALATDDAGVSRSSLAREFELAARTYRLSYPALRQMIRASLTYAFLPGTSIWEESPGGALVPACSGNAPGSATPSATCAIFLAENSKAALEWRQEAAFDEFERSTAERNAAR